MQMHIAAAMAVREQSPQQDPSSAAVVLPLPTAGSAPSGQVTASQRIPALRHTLAWQPGSATHWMQLGLAYLAAANPRGAQDALRKALQLDSTNRAARVGLAQVLSLQGYCLDAAQLCFEGLASDPSSMELHQALAEAFMQAGLFAQAGKVVRDAMALDGNGVQSSLLSAALLYRQHRFDACLETLDQVLAAEPGHALARRLQADALLISGRSQQRCDQAAPLCPADAATMASWQALLAPWHGLKVGLVWADHDPHPQALLRSMPLAEFAPLAGMPGVTFFSLQRGVAAREAVQTAEGMDCVPLSDALSSPSDMTAALLQMDLLITVDCETARQAAAIGCRTWIVLPEPACAHWMREREEAPAYPNVRLFRQPRRGQWQPALHQAAEALRVLVDAQAAAGRLDDTQRQLLAARTACEQYRYPEAERLFRELLANPGTWFPQIICAARQYMDRSKRYCLTDAIAPSANCTTDTLCLFTDLTAWSLARRDRRTEAFRLWQGLTAVGLPALSILMHYGEEAHRARDWKRAIDVWEKAMALYPDACLPPLHAAHSYKEQGDIDRAVACLRRSLALSPCQPEAHASLGCMLRDQGDEEQALRDLQLAVYLDPYRVSAWLSLGHLLYGSGNHYHAAAASFEQAIALEPGHDAWLHLGYCAYNKKDYEAAASSLDHALRYSPIDKDALFFKGYSLAHLDRHEEAVDAFEAARAIDPEGYEANEVLRQNLFIQYLHTQRYDKRRLSQYVYWSGRKLAGARWTGEPLNGKTLVVYQDAGFGDSLQCARYMKKIKEQYAPAKLILVVWPELTRLYKNVAGVDELHSISAVDLDKMHCDYYVGEYSVFVVLGIDPCHDAVPVPYLSADPELAAIWKGRLASDRNFKVGIAWAGNPGHANDAHRSSELEEWLPLADVPGLSFYAVQKGKSLAQAFDVPALRLATLETELTDFADAAALMSNLDLVISIDSAPAHLAGALGVPVWLMLPHTGVDWRWHNGGKKSDTEWYPNTKLFHRMPGQRWRDVLQSLRDPLRALSSRRRVDQ
jgi:tetratricopeptide (TPR) repeat protein